MKPASEALNAIQDESKRNQVKKLFEELEQLKIDFAEPLQKLKESQTQNQKYLDEIETNKLKILKIEGTDEQGKELTGLKKLKNDLANEEDFGNEENAEEIRKLITAENEKVKVLQNENIERERLAKETEQKFNSTKNALTSYFNKVNQINLALTELKLNNNFNAENIDTSRLRKPLDSTSQHTNNDIKKRIPSWEHAKTPNKKPKIHSNLETINKDIHLIESHDDKKFIGDWWSKKGFTVTASPGILAIKNRTSNTEIVITDKSASTTSTDEKDLRLMTQQLIDQLNKKGQLETAEFVGNGPKKDYLDRLFKDLKEEKLTQKSEFTMPNQSTNPPSPRMGGGFGSFR